MPYGDTLARVEQIRVIFPSLSALRYADILNYLNPDLRSSQTTQISHQFTPVSVGGLVISVPRIGAILDGQLVARMSDEPTVQRVISAPG